MAALAYRDDKILARNLLLRPFFCLTPAEPFFRPDRSTTAPSCRVAVKDGRAFRGHPKGLSLYEAFEVKHYFTFFISVSLFDSESRFFAPTHTCWKSARAGAVKAGRRSALTSRSIVSRLSLDSPEHGGTLVVSG
jgi:hypothetical protein